MGKALSRRTDVKVSEKAQYALTFGVVSVLLYFVGFPIFGITVLGGAAFLVIRLFSSGVRSESRKIFEFYLAANEILRDDNRRWFGFEIKEAIDLGEKLIASMHTAPPLLYFALGALYNKLGDSSSAEKHLSNVFDDSSADESAIVFPTPELRAYVRLLRRIEREPAESPQTSAAVRSLERIRTNLGTGMLEKCRENMNQSIHVELTEGKEHRQSSESVVVDKLHSGEPDHASFSQPEFSVEHEHETRDWRVNKTEQRKPITEVLHDIYDKKVH